MGSQYYLFGRFGNYSGGYGNAVKEDVMDLGGNRINQQIFGFDLNHFSESATLATDYLTTRQLDGAMKRDLAMDIKNPRQELPKNQSDIRNIEEIPRWGVDQIMISTKEDFGVHDQVKLLQDSTVNYLAQENLFTDPEVMGKAKYNTDRVGSQPKKETQASFYYGGSAAGRITDRLYDEEGTPMNWLTVDSAF
jgi:hypothetical protein